MLNTKIIDVNVRYNTESDRVQIFYNSVWNDWKRAFLQPTYLYHEGIEYTEITGGWDYAIGGAITKTSEYLEFTCSNQGYRAAMSNSIAIAIPEGATKLCILFKKLSGSVVPIGHSIQGNKPYTSGANNDLSTIDTPVGTYENHLVELPLPKDGVSGYVCPITTAATPQGKTIVAQISSIWYV